MFWEPNEVQQETHTPEEWLDHDATVDQAHMYLNNVSLETDQDYDFRAIEDEILCSEDPNQEDTFDFLVHTLGKKRARAEFNRLMADSGANISICNDKTKIHELRYYATPLHANVADKRQVKVLGYGLIKLRANDGRIIDIPVKYAPHLPNILSTHHLKKAYKSTWTKTKTEEFGTTGRVTLESTLPQGDNLGSTIHFDTTYVQGLPYLDSEPIPLDLAEHSLPSAPDIVCSLELDDSPDPFQSDSPHLSPNGPDVDSFMTYIDNLGHCTDIIHDSFCVNKVQTNALSLLWHNRLVHTNYDDIASLHKSVEGVPKIPVPQNNRVCPCISCTTGKISNAVMGKTDKHNNPTHAMQALHMDFGFVQSRTKRGDKEEEFKRITTNLLYFLSLNGVFSILVNFYPYSVIFLSYYFGVISILQLIILSVFYILIPNFQCFFYPTFYLR